MSQITFINNLNYLNIITVKKYNSNTVLHKVTRQNISICQICLQLQTSLTKYYVRGGGGVESILFHNIILVS